MTHVTCNSKALPSQVCCSSIPPPVGGELKKNGMTAIEQEVGFIVAMGTLAQFCGVWMFFLCLCVFSPWPCCTRKWVGGLIIETPPAPCPHFRAEATQCERASAPLNELWEGNEHASIHEHINHVYPFTSTWRSSSNECASGTFSDSRHLFLQLPCGTCSRNSCSGAPPSAVIYS